MRKKKVRRKFLDKMVMVHPDLTTDPSLKQGKVGKVIGISGMDKDIITVKFADGKLGNYMPDSLLLLLPKAKILQNAGLNIDLSNEDKWTLLKIFKSIAWGKENDALKIASKNESILSLSTINFARWMERTLRQGQNKKLK